MIGNSHNQKETSDTLQLIERHVPNTILFDILTLNYTNLKQIFCVLIELQSISLLIK